MLSQHHIDIPHWQEETNWKFSLKFPWGILIGRKRNGASRDQLMFPCWVEVPGCGGNFLAFTKNTNKGQRWKLQQLQQRRTTQSGKCKVCTKITGVTGPEHDQDHSTTTLFGYAVVLKFLGPQHDVGKYYSHALILRHRFFVPSWHGESRLKKIAVNDARTGKWEIHGRTTYIVNDENSTIRDNRNDFYLSTTKGVFWHCA